MFDKARRFYERCDAEALSRTADTEDIEKEHDLLSDVSSPHREKDSREYILE